MEIRMFPVHILPLLAIFLLLLPAAFAQDPPVDLHPAAEKGDVTAVRALLARAAPCRTCRTGRARPR